jgi:hypothetical protein
VLLAVRGPWPLPALVRRVLTGVGERRRGPRGVEGERALACPTLREARRAMGPLFTWTDAYALGVVVPDSSQAGWARGHPQTFAALAMAERLVRRWPGLRQLGDRVVLEARRVAR